MSVFADDEREYLLSGVRLGRLATLGPDGGPHVVPTGFRYNTELDTIDIGGHDFARRKKYRDVLRNPKVAFVVDDLASVNPWRPRGIEIRGEARVLDSGGRELGPGFDQEMFRITPDASSAGGFINRCRSRPEPFLRNASAIRNKNELRHA